MPCFNHGAYISEAIESVLAQTCREVEIIVINDGSTDPATVRVLKQLSYPNVTIIHSENRGVSAARNLGIERARGKYILPLDADDKIGSTYIEKAAAILEQRPEIGIVYCEAEFFGNKTGKWHLPPYKFPDVLIYPRIFCSSLFRRSDWVTVGGFSTDMRYGWEDFDFWLSLIERGCGVYQIPETLFYYRQSGAGMTKSMKREHLVYSYERLFARHKKLYSDNIGFLFGAVLDSASADQDVRCGASFQLFLPARPYNEAKSLRASFLTGRWQRLTFELPSGCTGEVPLRLDPMEFPGLIQIAAVQIKSRSGEILWSARTPSEFRQMRVREAKRVQHDRVFQMLSTTNDPQLHLPKLKGAQFEQPVKLQVWVRVVCDSPTLIQTAGNWLDAQRKPFFSF